MSDKVGLIIYDSKGRAYSEDDISAIHKAIDSGVDSSGFVAPEGWEFEKVKTCSVPGFIIRSPRVDGVQHGTAIFEDSKDAAEKFLFLILESVSGS